MEDAVRRVEQAEARVRELLMLTCRDDSYGTQVDLREALSALEELREELRQLEIDEASIVRH